MQVNWKTKWIWDSGESQPRNYRLKARRSVWIKSKLQSAVLHISADSRYRLYVNGDWLGDGPARCFPHHQQFDTYDVKPFLNPDKNVIAVTVNHYGEGTFHYNLGRGGLLCQIDLLFEDGSSETIISNDDWKVAQHKAYETRSPRTSCQMPFEENYDARRIDPQWIEVSFNDASWENATVIGPVGMSPWTEMVPRRIPFLTRVPYYPTRIVSARQVRPVSLVETVNIRPYLLPNDKTANHQQYRGLIATDVVSSKDQTVEFSRLWTIDLGEWLINGQAIRPRPGWEAVKVDLKKGANLFIANLVGQHHFVDFTLAIDAASPIEIQAPFGGSGKWLIVGPLAEDRDEANRIFRNIKTRDDLVPLENKFHFSEEKNEAKADVWNITYSQKTLPGQPNIEQIENMLADNAQFTTIYPSDNDVEIILDFGMELVGFSEFEMDAPAGVMLDFNCFEAINDGEIQWTRGNRSSFRYVTRQGRQHFVTDWRRGFRYATMTLRNVAAPVEIRYVRTLMSTYPAVERGAFYCSDDRLSQIWRVGRHTLLCCMEDVFTDCPTYEQTYWVGDGRNEALISYAAYGEWPLTARCVKLPPQSLLRSKLPESQVPSAWQNILTAWSLLWVQMVHEYWLHSGDVETLREVYPAIAQTLHTCREFSDNEYGLMSIKAWNMFDWAGVDDHHKLVAHNNMFLVAALDRAADMARAISHEDDVSEWQTMAKKIRVNINTHLWSGTLGGYIDSIHDDGTPSEVVSQQTNTLALLYNIAPTERQEKIAKYTTDPPAGMVTFGSPFAMFYLLEELAKERRFDDILTIIRDRWGFMLDAGATTFWETFPGFESRVPTRSHCHAWSAAPTFFLSTYQLGVSPLEPGYTKALIAPQPAGLRWCKGRMPTPLGEVHVNWELNEEQFAMTLQLPDQVAAKAVLPVDAGDYKVLRIDQKPLKKRLPAGVTAVQQEKGKWVIHLAPGKTISMVASRCIEG